MTLFEQAMQELERIELLDLGYTDTEIEKMQAGERDYFRGPEPLSLQQKLITVGWWCFGALVASSLAAGFVLALSARR